MTPNQINLVKKTWKLFREMEPSKVGDAFYSRLFNNNPSLRKMFPSDMNAQYRKLMDMLSTIVARLDRLSEIDSELQQMGQRHIGYGVRPGHYKLVGDALLWTLKQGLGSDWCPPIEDAWKSCYAIIIEKMTTP